MADYDIVGDIHGHADALRALLKVMGYREQGGAWRHPDRKVVFLGDFIDRGPEQLETVGIARAMVEAGSALAVMGNHELNAIAWHTPDAARPGEYLRTRVAPPHGPKNRDQHQAFLAAVESDAALHRELVEWFLTLPLWLDLPELRVVHACWHPQRMAELEPQLGPGRTLRRELVLDRAVECVTKGIEVPLPEGVCFTDGDRHQRTDTRVRWWDASATTWRTGAHAPPAVRAQLPDTPLPEWARVGYPDDKPLFVGHYWQSGTPELLAPNVACVDYSAGRGAPLVAYRFSGEPALTAANFVASRSA